MSEALKALETASRRGLQTLAKELHLCKGNSKSDVIVSYAMQFLSDHPKDGEHQVLKALGGNSSTPVASPMAKKVTPKKQEKAVVNEPSKQQPEDEPAIIIKSVEVVEVTKTPTKKEQTSTKKEKNSSTKAEKENKVTPKDKKKAKQVETTPTSTKSPKTKASPATKKSPTSKAQSTSVEKKTVDAKEEKPATVKKVVPVGKKAEIKARKAVEALVKSVKDLTFIGDSRVRCSTTGHEMMAEVDVINAYIHGKRYQKARNLMLSFAKYAPMFVDHPDESKSNMLWCNVTESAIARDAQSVKKHMAAPKYKKQLPIWKEEEAAKKKAEEEEAQRRASRIEAAKKRRLEAAKEESDDTKSDRPTKRKRTANKSDK
ncbi:Surfeit locus protein 2 [Phytophthora citrophthora]|uniref:Surfeit locus protein 2 n=1 Tax=Phytophthora citrophthora TaxID=4793 RepID=A0AAD9GXK1_9STRA|nr:Surfeit locus protein 2 [Phytophthora citrophthora]